MQSSYTSSPYRSSYGASMGQTSMADRLVTGAFRDLATNESMVSHLSSKGIKSLLRINLIDSHFIRLG